MNTDAISILRTVLDDIEDVAECLEALKKGKTRLAGSLSCFENCSEESGLSFDTPLRLPALEEILLRGLEVDSTRHKVWFSTGDDRIDAYIYLERDGTAVLRVEDAKDATLYVEAHSPEIQAYAEFRLPD